MSDFYSEEKLLGCPVIFCKCKTGQSSTNSETEGLFETKYSRMDLAKFVEDSL